MNQIKRVASEIIGTANKIPKSYSEKMPSNLGVRSRKPYLISQTKLDNVGQYFGSGRSEGLQHIGIVRGSNIKVDEQNDSDAYAPSLVSFKRVHSPDSESGILNLQSQERIHKLPEPSKQLRNLNFMSNSLRFKDLVLN